MRKIRFKIVDFMHKKVEITGWLFTVKNRGYFVVHRNILNKKAWVVSDYLTGCGLGVPSINTRRRAVLAAVFVIESKSQKFLKEKRIEALQKFWGGKNGNQKIYKS